MCETSWAKDNGRGKKIQVAYLIIPMDVHMYVYLAHANVVFALACNPNRLRLLTQILQGALNCLWAEKRSKKRH